MADESTQSAQTDEQTPAAEPHGEAKAPDETPKDWEAEYRKAVEQSRKWEARAKANSTAAKELDEMRKSSMTDAERLAEAQKRVDEAEAKVAEFERKAERAAIVAEVAASKGVDAEWLGRMSGDTREEVEANADYIASKLSGSPIYPSVTDNGGAKSGAVTKADIEAIKDPKERVRMRAKHLDLYR